MDKAARRILVKEKYVVERKSINQIAKELEVNWDTVKRDLLHMNVILSPTINQYGCGNGVSDSLFLQIISEQDAYWLGLLYADGSIRTERNEISLDLSEKDKSLIEKFHLYCKNNNQVREHIIRREDKEFKSYVSSFSNAKVKQNLINLGCVPKKSLVLTCPNENQVPSNLFIHFLRGYIDGDGYIQFDREKRKYRVVICGTKEFLQGIMLRMNLFEGCTISKDSNIFILTIGQKELVYNLLLKLYNNATIYMERKFQIFANITGVK